MTTFSIIKKSFNLLGQNGGHIKLVKNDIFSCQCTACLKVISCKHMGERAVSRHISSVLHQKNAKGLKNIGSFSLPREEVSARHNWYLSFNLYLSNKCVCVLMMVICRSLRLKFRLPMVLYNIIYQ